MNHGEASGVVWSRLEIAIRGTGRMISKLFWKWIGRCERQQATRFQFTHRTVERTVLRLAWSGRIVKFKYFIKKCVSFYIVFILFEQRGYNFHFFSKFYNSDVIKQQFENANFELNFT